MYLIETNPWVVDREGRGSDVTGAGWRHSGRSCKVEDPTPRHTTPKYLKVLSILTTDILEIFSNIAQYSQDHFLILQARPDQSGRYHRDLQRSGPGRGNCSPKYNCHVLTPRSRSSQVFREVIRKLKIIKN